LNKESIVLEEKKVFHFKKKKKEEEEGFDGFQGISFHKSQHRYHGKDRMSRVE
jgi:hypothetical protein